MKATDGSNSLELITDDAEGMPSCSISFASLSESVDLFGFTSKFHFPLVFEKAKEGPVDASFILYSPALPWEI